MYTIILSDNIELKNGYAKVTVPTLEEAKRALRTELLMACKEKHIDQRYERYLQIDEHTISCDYGSWSDFIGIHSDTPITLESI